MRRLVLIAVILSIAGSAFAQQRPRQPNETFLSRTYPTHFSQNNLRDHPWQHQIESRRFVVLYDPQQANISAANAQTALNNLEEIFDVFIYDNGFRHPYEGRAANQQYKMCVYVLRPGEGHAFGGTTGSPSGPGMWLSSNAVGDWWALAHEFVHGLQSMAGGMAGGITNQGNNFRGWFYESHANLMPHLGRTNEVHGCSEMYTRMSNRYLGSTRNHYCNWPFWEYIIHRYGIKIVNDLWLSAQSGANHDPFTEFMHRNDRMSQRDFGDVFGDFATKMAIFDINRHQIHGETTLRSSVHHNTAYANRGSARFRGAWNNVNARYRRSRFTYLEELPDTPAGNNANGNRYVVPFAGAPQRYGYNVIRLYPDQSTGTVTVRFRGDMQTQNNISNYTRNTSFPLEPVAANLPNNPGSDWRYGLVAVTGDATSNTGTVTARYSRLMRASDNNPDVSITMQSGETQLYLVVAATPTVHHKISWDQFYYTIYRFPYMVEINGAKPEGFQTMSTANMTRHANGNGWKSNASTVAATAFVGPDARVEGSARVEGNARIEGRARVAGGTVRGSAIVRDHAFVNAGTIEGSAIIEEGANIWGGTFNENARVGGIANVLLSGGGRVSGSARISGVPWIDNVNLQMSGTAQIYGDAEVHGVTVTRGVFTGFIDQGITNNTQHGSNLTALPREVTAPRSMRWYGDASTDVRPVTAASQKVNSFSMSNRGVFNYQLGGGVNGARLKMFDGRGRLIETVQLSAAQGTINMKTSAAQMVIWRVESADGKIIGKSGSSIIVR